MMCSRAEASSFTQGLNIGHMDTRWNGLQLQDEPRDGHCPNLMKPVLSVHSISRHCFHTSLFYHQTALI